MGLQNGTHPNGRPQGSGDQPQWSLLWLELTGKCNLECVHCYAMSGPHVPWGSLTTQRWRQLIDEAAEMRVRTVQFIGGEPTLHPDLALLVRHAHGLGIGVEVYSNLVRVSEPLWDVFEEANVHLATSFYSLNPSVHDAITRRNSQERTLANIRRAVSRNIPLRIGIVGIRDDQELDATVEFLRAETGILATQDRMRGDGRDGDRLPVRSIDELCGRCASANAAIDPNGLVYPCVFSRWMVLGDVNVDSLRDVLAGEAAHAVRAQLGDAFAQRESTSPTAVGHDDSNSACRPRCCAPWCCPNQDEAVASPVTAAVPSTSAVPVARS